MRPEIERCILNTDVTIRDTAKKSLSFRKPTSMYYNCFLQEDIRWSAKKQKQPLHALKDRVNISIPVKDRLNVFSCLSLSFLAMRYREQVKGARRLEYKGVSGPWYHVHPEVVA
jgi:hypothetical protein